ncbi:boophilin-H2-like [Achroia grisella]|uniref:boophilin-H2-like n=1 Tax=Achroia grisella TaxID=688607 RepID=UPI0027D2D8D2|nr:boophilin-H2-like [Achroia grisella]
MIIFRYYYNAQLDRCLLFDYSGCAGNKNNFKSLIDCERYCKGANYFDLKNIKPPTFCSLQPDSGLCLALITKYYYDVNEGRCKSFKYGGCGGNQNRFDTMAACRRHCFVSTS